MSATLADRENTVSQNECPTEILVYFSMRTISYLDKFLIDSVISSFIWAGKHTKIGKTLLHKSSGGLGLPNLMGYHWVASVSKIKLWFASPQSSWCQIKAKSCSSSSLQALACSTLLFSPVQFTCNHVVINSLMI